MLYLQTKDARAHLKHESNGAHVAAKYEVVLVCFRQGPVQSFRVKVRLEIVAVQAVFFSAFHLTFEIRHAIGTVMFQPTKGFQEKTACLYMFLFIFIAVTESRRNSSVTFKVSSVFPDDVKSILTSRGLVKNVVSALKGQDWRENSSALPMQKR
jgi:hypothetical protein